MSDWPTWLVYVLWRLDCAHDAIRLRLPERLNLLWFCTITDRLWDEILIRYPDPENP